MRDRDVRAALHQKVLRDHHDDPETLVLDELGLRHGSARVDIAVVNGYLHGYEIKSDADTLERLPGQIEVYSSVLDRATIVVGERHIKKVESLVPTWWGLRVATQGSRGAIKFPVIRSARINRGIDLIAVAELLWRPEVIAILRGLGTPEAFLRKPRAVLYRHLVSTTRPNELRALVRQQLKSREKWRGQRPPSSNVGYSIPTPTL